MRVVVLGPGAAGKSTFARGLSAATGTPCVELDSVFWSADLEPTAPDEWVSVQEELTKGKRWILDGDLGPHDVLDVRLRRADTIVLFDIPTWRCVWRAARRSREQIEFWRWLLSWRRFYRPQLLEAIKTHASAAKLIIVRDSADEQQVMDLLAAGGTGKAR